MVSLNRAVSLTTPSQVLLFTRGKLGYLLNLIFQIAGPIGINLFGQLNKG